MKAFLIIDCDRERRRTQRPWELTWVRTSPYKWCLVAPGLAESIHDIGLVSEISVAKAMTTALKIIAAESKETVGFEWVSRKQNKILQVDGDVRALAICTQDGKWNVYGLKQNESNLLATGLRSWEQAKRIAEETIATDTIGAHATKV